MLYPLRGGEIDKLIPAVATGDQFAAALGRPEKILQRVMISSIGGVITLLISQSQVSSRFYAVWLILGVSFILYILWGPIVEASKKNSKLRKYTSAALFDGYITNVSVREKVVNRQEQANKIGKLELVESRRTWLLLDLEDEDGYLGELSFPMDKKHKVISKGKRILCIVLSNDKQFSRIIALSDAWLPNERLWVGDYPYLLRPAFEEYCKLRLNNKRNYY